MLSHMTDLLTRLSVVHLEELVWALFGWIGPGSYKSSPLVSYGTARSRLFPRICHHRVQIAGGPVSYETSSR